MVQIEQIFPSLTWEIRHKVMYPEMSLDNVKLPEDEKGIHFGLFDHIQLISITSTFKSGEEMQFRKFATLAEYQHQGYGSKLLKYIIDFAKAEGCKRLWCNARKNASTFYSNFGFRETDITFFKDGYDFVIMELKFTSIHGS